MQFSATSFGVRSRTRRLTVTVLTFVALVVSMLVLVPSAEAARRSAAPSAVRVVSAFQNVSAQHLAALDHDVDCDVLVFADDIKVREQVIALAGIVAVAKTSQ